MALDHLNLDFAPYVNKSIHANVKATRNRISYKKKKLPTREFMHDKRKSAMEESAHKKPSVGKHIYCKK